VGLGAESERKYRDLIPRIILALFIISITAGMYLSLVSKSAGWIDQSIPTLKEGDIAKRREVALFDFAVPKPDAQLRQERNNAENATMPVFTLNRDISTTINAEIDSLFSAATILLQKDSPDSLKDSVIRQSVGLLDPAYPDSLSQIMRGKSKSFGRNLNTVLKKSIADVFNKLIVSSTDDLFDLTDELIMLEDDGDTRMIQISETLGVAEAAIMAGDNLVHMSVDGLNKKQTVTLQSIAKQLVRPNVVYNREKSKELRDEARIAVPEFLASYQENERIIDANEPAAALQVAAIEVMKKELSRRSFMENRREHYLIALGKTIIAFGIFGIFVGYLVLYRRKIFSSFSRLLLLTIIMIFPLSIGFYSSWSGGVSEYLVPVAIASILTTILFDAELGILLSILISFFVASLVPGSGIRMGVIYFIAGGVGAISVGRVRHRKEFYRSMFFLPLTMAVAIASTNDWLANPSFADVSNDMLLGALNGFACPIFAIGILPLLESVFKVTTDITLLELSDLNNPLLKELAVKAPGTFASVLAVGTLAEAGAEKIGANSLLSRVGAYYHDIGKMIIPEYFIENQMGGENPHDRLTPYMSALVIASHVKEGHELGTKHGLPEAILDIIQQHHGTSLMASIYQKAVDESDNNTVDESAFRYPGPKPQTREAGIVMLADLVEAASRSVRERSPGRLNALISTIIQKRFMDGELNECDLTLKDLHDMEESFLPVLIGSHHGRIEYPWQEKEKNENKHNGTPEKAEKDIKKAGQD